MNIPFVSEATVNHYKTVRASGASFMEWIHGYIYGRWIYHYIGLTGDKKPWWRFFWYPLFYLINRHSPFLPTKKNKTGDPNQTKPTWGDTYHGKSLPLEEATKLIKLDRAINTEVPEQVLPFTRAREIVLENPTKLAVIDCPCRSAMTNPCMPMDVCLVVGDPFVSFILQHHPTKSRAITSDEAVRILKAENARGHVTHAFFKDVMMGRFYAICNCCSCCCGAMKAQRHGLNMLCSSGYMAEVDADKCVGCGVCAEKCQFRAIGFRKDQAFIRPKRCMGCGVCIDSCAKDALSLRLAPERGEPLLVEKL
ncbi:MAG: 4Fe-4S binding protein [Pseudodesulfovibrio sp.]